MAFVRFAESTSGRRQIMVIAGLALLLIGLLAFLGVDRALRNAALTEAQAAAQNETAILAASLESELDKFSMVPMVLAEDPQVQALLAGDASHKPVLNTRLEELAAQTGAAAIYLMDARGLTLAASNWNLPQSFVGSNYRFREYFSSAIGAGSATQFALGTVSRRPGLYIAQRAADSGKNLGVVVIKVEFDRLEESWRKATPGVFVTNAEGIVLITSNPDWRFTTTGTVPESNRDAALDDREFGISSLKPIPLSTDQGQLVKIPLIETREAISPEGWELHMLADPSSALAVAEANARLVLLLGLVSLGGAAGGTALWLRRREARTAAVAAERMARLRDQLQQANRLATLGQITAGIGHEIRQPVAAMRVYAENGERLLLAENRDGLRDIFTKIISLTERVRQITDELRRFSRRGSREPREMALGQVIDGAQLLLHDRISQLGTALELPDALLTAIMVRGEHVALEQVLVNLLQNALDASGENGRISISITPDEGACRLTISDDGPGVPEELHDTLFQPFVTSKPDGLGLGLVISREIMRSLGGDLLAEESPSGARFTMVIPRA